ncbi:MAG: glycine cleavage system protein H [Candidatus Heimdallarchaeota archaeon]|nr:glycine cleavage system protein H [Candidatus Heimdallarchaeota archaeon]
MIIDHKGHKFDFPDELLYWESTKNQYWIQRVSDTKIRMGITSIAAQVSERIESINLKKEGGKVSLKRSFGTLESGKWLGPIRSPINGEITKHNEEVLANPSHLNRDPYGAWIVELEGMEIDENLKEFKIAPINDSFIAFIKKEIKDSLSLLDKKF